MGKKKNVILITLDHLRYDALGCTGNPVIRTPNIDSLGSQGVIFDSFFVQSPVCQASRATIMTGRYPRNHGVKWNKCALNENELTMMEYFKDNGYTTAMIGKHHVNQKRFGKSIDYMAAHGIRRNWEYKPNGGYDISLEDENEFEKYVHLRGFKYKTGFALDGFKESLGAVPSDLPGDCHIDAYIGMKCRNYISGVSREKPFFLWLGFYGPHHPYVPSGEFAKMYDPDSLPPFNKSSDDFTKKPIEYSLYKKCNKHKFAGFESASEDTFRRMKAAYYGMISQIDHEVGLVVHTLRKNELFDDTVIVLTSDHGEFAGDHGLPGKAPFLLDCMLHVPCIIRMPGAKEGERVQELAESVDLFPTITGLLNLDAPEFLQGRRLSRYVEKESNEGVSKREYIYAEAVDKKCIKTERWKYIHYPSRDCGELYDLEKDPHELNNIYFENVSEVSQMKELFYKCMDETEEFLHPVYSQFSGIDTRTGKKISHYLTW